MTLPLLISLLPRKHISSITGTNRINDVYPITAVYSRNRLKDTNRNYAENTKLSLLQNVVNRLKLNSERINNKKLKFLLAVF
jgi:hypothetical protein